MKFEFVVHDRGDSSVGINGLTEDVTVELGGIENLTDEERKDIEDGLKEMIFSIYDVLNGSVLTAKEWLEDIEAESDALEALHEANKEEEEEEKDRAALKRQKEMEKCGCL